MRRRSLSAGILLVASCGRFEFHSNPDAAADPDAAPDTNVLACGTPTRFQLGASNLEALKAVATPTGFALFTVDGATDLRGWSYDWNGTTLAVGAQNVAIGTGATNTVGAAAFGSQLLVATIYGNPAPLGTRLYPLDADLTVAAELPRPGMMIGDSAIAVRGDGNDLALLNVEPTDRVDARRVTAQGADVGPATIVVDSAEGASSVWMAAAAGGYVVSWTSRAGTPNLNRLALLDANLATVAGPVTTSTTGFDSIRGSVIWAPQSNRYLVAWFEKNVTDGDDVWFQIYDANLAPVTPTTMLAPLAVFPRVATDGTAFWVAWEEASSGSLAAASIAPDGTVVPRPVPTTGGTPEEFTMVARNGQAVLVWVETGGTGPDLWLDPMCP